MIRGRKPQTMGGWVLRGHKPGCPQRARRMVAIEIKNITISEEAGYLRCLIRRCDQTNCPAAYAQDMDFVDRQTFADRIAEL
jgi:hypothetical protein